MIEGLPEPVIPGWRYWKPIRGEDQLCGRILGDVVVCIQPIGHDDGGHER